MAKLQYDFFHTFFRDLKQNSEWNFINNMLPKIHVVRYKTEDLVSLLRFLHVNKDDIANFGSTHARIRTELLARNQAADDELDGLDP